MDAWYRLARSVSRGLPSSWAWSCADRAADLRWLSWAAGRQGVQANLGMVLGSAVSERSAPVREVFRNFARYLLELLDLSRAVERATLRVEGDASLATVKAQGGGAILVTAHVGNWELLAAVAARRLGLSVSAVALPHPEEGVDRFFNAQRQRQGIELIPLGPQAGQESLHALRRGRALGVLGDRPFGEPGVWVRAFGRLIRLPRGPALMSLRSRAPMVPMFLIREARTRFRVVMDAPIWPGPEAGDQAVLTLVQSYAESLERLVRRAPTQWLLFDAVDAKPLPRLRVGGAPAAEAPHAVGSTG